MTGQIVQALKSMIDTIRCGYDWEYDEATNINKKADYVENEAGLIYLEEVRNMTITVPQVSGSLLMQKQTQITLEFCRFSKELGQYAGLGDTPASTSFDNLTATRQRIRDRIEAEVAYPFLDLLANKFETYFPGFTLSTVECRYVHGRFDANEVGVEFNFTITQRVTCASNLW